MDLEALHKLQEAGAVMRSVESKLYRLAGAFDATGNETMAEKLRDLAGFSRRADTLVEAGVTGALSHSLSATEQATANMLMATVAVADRMASPPPLNPKGEA